eukprot:10394065-Alexandrium_andersonii.AAC.1
MPQWSSWRPRADPIQRCPPNASIGRARAVQLPIGLSAPASGLRCWCATSAGRGAAWISNGA